MQSKTALLTGSRSLLPLILIGLLLVTAAPASAQMLSITFTKIADTNTLIPDGGGQMFSDFGQDPSIDPDGNVAFGGAGGALRGVYTSIDGTLSKGL